MIAFTVWGVPQSKGSSRAFMPKGGKFPVVTSTNRNLKHWEHKVASAAQAVCTGTMVMGPVELRIAFVLPRPLRLKGLNVPHETRPDLSKLIRGAEDALNNVLWKDDGQVASIEASKRYANQDETPHAKIEILEIV